jgi:hypothetical protein
LFLTVIAITFADEIALHETQHNKPGALLFHMRANHWSFNRKGTNKTLPCTDKRLVSRIGVAKCRWRYFDVQQPTKNIPVTLTTKEMHKPSKEYMARLLLVLW